MLRRDLFHGIELEPSEDIDKVELAQFNDDGNEDSPV